MMNHELLSQSVTFVDIGLLGQLKRKINDREIIMIKTIEKKKIAEPETTAECSSTARLTDSSPPSAVL